MNGYHQGPMSPVSVAGSEWSGITKYQSGERFYNSPTAGNNSRNNLSTPPLSGSGMSGIAPHGMNGRINDNRGNPSPPESNARSSSGTQLSAEGQRKKQSMMEDSLAQHYTVLKRYLARSLREDQTNGKSNRARDKLLRLSAVQFQELSTDVYDELLRRQTNGGPKEAYLLPKENFHPKRNQARQKLSTLPDQRFSALATDVFFELERRVPRFAAGDIDRRNSPANSMRAPPSRTGTPNGVRSESREPGGRRPYPSRQGSLGGQVLAGLGIPGIGSQDDYNRPTPKSSQSNTIVPNKSYLVEDDDEQDTPDDNSSIYGMRKRDTSRSNGTSSEQDKKMIADYQVQVEDLKGKVNDLENHVQEKESLINRLENNQRNHENAHLEWSKLRNELEDKLTNALNLNNNLQSEIDKVKSYHSDREKDLRSQLDSMAQRSNGSSEWEARYKDVQRDNQELQRELEEQQHITNEVRQEASAFLEEMKAISDRSSQGWQREEMLVQQVQRLEEEISEWKSRYARMKTQVRTLRTESMGLALQQPNISKQVKDGGLKQPDGLVKDIHVTKFQIAIDEVLRVARVGEAQTVLDSMKLVVASVRNIVQDISDTASSNDEVTKQAASLRNKISATANNFITASKNYASANGISPVSLLDAAASHLAASIVELVRTVKIRPTPAEELAEDEMNDERLALASPRSFTVSNDRSSIDESSVYSPRSTAQRMSEAPISQRISELPNGQPKDYSTARQPASKNGLANGKPSDYFQPRLGYGMRPRDDELEDLKLFLEDQTEGLVQSIQSLVSSIRLVEEADVIHDRISSIVSVVGHVVKETQRVIDNTGNTRLRDETTPVVRTLAGCRVRMLEKDDDGREIQDHVEWKTFMNTLPPIAFEIARETKELVQRVDRVGEEGRDVDDFR